FPQADRGFLILEEEGLLVPRIVKTRRAPPPGDEADELAHRFSRTIVSRCLATGQSLLSEDVSRSKGPPISESVADSGMRSVMCVPLLSRAAGRALGVIQLDTQDRAQPFTQDDLKLLLAVAAQATSARESAVMHAALLEQTALARELELACSVQKSFLP